MITQEWATNYCQRLMSQNNLSFPFRIGRKKNWGGIDAVSTVTDEDSFFRCYKEFDEHPRCVGIFIIKEDNTIISI